MRRVSTDDGIGETVAQHPSCGRLQFVGLSIKRTSRLGRSAPIDVAGVGDLGDEDEVFGIVRRVDDSVIANADAQVIPPGKLQ